MSPAPLIRMSRIRKRFGLTQVLDDARMDIFPGEVHLLAGENGAGKSTLIRILAGVYGDWEGEIEYFGKVTRLRSVDEARRLGLAVIHQELSLVPAMSVAENLFLGRNVTTLGLVRRSEQRLAARRLLTQVGLDASPDDLVEDLPLAGRQLLEIAKALSTDASVIVMDEPTSALPAYDANRLFELIARLKAGGRAIVYITHRMEEIERLADRITVLRDGRWIGTRMASELPEAELIRWMVGRDIAPREVTETAPPGPGRLQLTHLSVRNEHARDIVRDVSLTLHRGEITGLAGLQGSGAAELLEAAFGLLPGSTRGEIRLDGQVAEIRSPRDAIRYRLALVTADRKTKGLNLRGSVLQNGAIAALPGLSPWCWRRPARERAAVGAVIARLHLKASSLDSAADELSGGNQQKLVLAKWLLTRPDVLLLDEPTRGVDIGAREEIYKLIDQCRREGMAILLNSTDIPELLAMCDRILVLHRGRVTAELPREVANPERILAAAMGKPALQ